MRVATWAQLVSGGNVVVWALLIRGRAKGKRRCPKCWYDMPATDGMTCPECGRTQSREKEFAKRRRSWKLASVGGLLLMASYGASVTPDVKRNGWMWAVPRWALVLMVPVLEPPARTESNYRFIPLDKFPAPKAGMFLEADSPLPQQLWFHLFYQRLSAKDPTTFEYAILRHHHVRRHIAGSTTPFEVSCFTDRFRDRLIGDREYMSFVIRDGLTQFPGKAGSFLFAYTPMGTGLPLCTLTLNGIEVQSAGALHTNHGTISVSASELTRHGIFIPVDTDGTGRAPVSVKVSLSTAHPEPDRPPDIIRHEFTITLVDERLKGE